MAGAKQGWRELAPASQHSTDDAPPQLSEAQRQGQRPQLEPVIGHLPELVLRHAGGRSIG
jgi:hypothetical protein